MLDSLKISGFRAFKEYTVDNLGRVNLFVGRNNSGKTTILEAAEILLASDSPAAVLRSALRRGEMYVPRNQDRPNQYADVSHLFHGHTCEAGGQFRISGTESGSPLWLVCEMYNVKDYPDGSRAFFADEDLTKSWLGLYINHSRSSEKPVSLPMMSSGAVPLDAIRRQRLKPSVEERPVSFVKAETLDTEKLRESWDALVLADEERSVTDSLRILEPRIEKIAFVATGIYLRHSGVENPMPLGTLGDGIRHILTLSVAVSRSRRGFVMIDEIDTGLHHSVMADMWRVLVATAERLDVQIFATTHSLDCVRSLAWLFSRDSNLAGLVRLHRVDNERGETVVYSPEEILTAAQHDVELRGW